MAIQTLSLKTAPLQFAEFKPVVYQQQVADKNILRDSLSRVEARRREANASKDSYIASVNAIRDVLDPSEYAGFDEEFKNVSNRIGELIELGDSGEAIHLANTVGRDMATDPKWKNKAQVKAQRDEWLKEAKSSGFDSVTIRRMEEENPYYDDNTGKFNHGTYNKVIPFSDIINMAVGRTPNRQSSNTTSTTTSGDTFSKDGKTTTNPLTKDKTLDTSASLLYSSSTSKTNGVNITELKEEDMYNTFKQLITEPSVNASLRQQFSDMQWLYAKSNSILEDPTASERDKLQAERDKQTALDMLQGEDGFLILGNENDEETFDAWVENNAKKYFKNAAYRHVSTQTSKTDTIDYNTGTKSGSGSDSDTTSGTNVSDYGPGTTSGYLAVEDDSNKTNGSTNAAPSAAMKNVKSK